MNLENLVRKNIQQMQPYSCARDEFKGIASVYLDANENPYNSPFNRYPDPMQWDLKCKISDIKNVPTQSIFLGNGSDEAIDLLYRAFCEPRVDNVVAIEPTYGMYKVCAAVNDVEYRKVLLDENFLFRADELLTACDTNTKLIWICSPNNPTGNSMKRLEITKLIAGFNGIIVLDEAYIDFSSEESYVGMLQKFPNLVILQTMSKAWGSAALRLGMAFASPEVISILNKIKYPYNINLLTQQKALTTLRNPSVYKKHIRLLLKERDELINNLKNLPFVQYTYPTDANFVLVKVDNATAIYEYLVSKSIIVRNRTNVTLCLDCLRITVGTPRENDILFENLRKFSE